MELVSRGSRGWTADAGSFDPAISSDGSAIAFDSDASDLQEDPEFDGADVFVARRPDGRIRLVSRGFDGSAPNGPSYDASASADGRWIAFTSAASNLVRGDRNDLPDVFVRDMVRGRTEMVSLAGRTQSDGVSDQPSISGDGRFVAFTSRATNLIPGSATRTRVNVFVIDRRTRRLKLASPVPDGATAGPSERPAISGNGRFVAFESRGALDPRARDSLHGIDIFVRDLAAQTTILASRSGTVREGNSVEPSISFDGRRIAFTSTRSDLVVGDLNGTKDVFVFDRVGRRVVRASAGRPEPDGPSHQPSISPDGAFVAFASTATNLAADDRNGVTDVYLSHLRSGRVTRLSLSRGGSEGVDRSWDPSVSWGARVVVFESYAPNLVLPDVNRSADVFVVRRAASTCSTGADEERPGFSQVHEAESAAGPAGAPIHHLSCSVAGAVPETHAQGR